MHVSHRALGQFLAVVPPGLGERPAELSGECDVIVAASPAEVAVRLVTWCRSAAASERRTRAARLADGVRQRRARQSEDVRLLATTCMPTNTITALVLIYSVNN